MANGTYLLMAHTTKPYEELGDDERILIGGLQERGFSAERLEFPRVNVFSSVVPTPKQQAEVDTLRKQLRIASYRLNLMTVVACMGYAFHGLAAWLRGEHMEWVGFAVGMAVVVALRFALPLLWTREVR